MSLSPLLLRPFELFRSLGDEEFDALSHHASLCEKARREIIFQKNHEVSSLGLLLEGRLQGVDMTLDGREAGLYFVDEGDFFGDLAIVDGLPSPEFIVALSPVRIIFIPAPQIRALLAASAEVARFVNLRLAKRLREALAQRALLSLPNPLHRVCTQLTRMILVTSSGQHIVPHAPTHQELAIMINATRETVTRVFQQLQKSGVLKRDGDKLLIVKPESLSLLLQKE